MAKLALYSFDQILLDSWLRLLPQHECLVARDLLSLEEALGENPNVVLVDLASVNIDFHGTIWPRWLAASRWIAATGVMNDEEGLAVLDAGCVGYIQAFAIAEVLEEAISAVLMGQVWVGRQLMQRILKGIRQQSTDIKPQIKWQTKLSDRELEVAKLAAMASSNKQIALALGITERTVKAHLTAIFEKLDISDRLQLALVVHGIMH